MCGFCGVVTAESDKKVDPIVLEDMLASLTRRGPDGQGIHCEPGCALGHRRLKVIDLVGGKQPMVSTDGRLYLVFNGEIYNFLDLKRQLENRGHNFRESSDTEVLLHCCQEWGMDCLSRLVGMFAFALWDSRERKLWLVRDRLGMKPLYYSLTDRGDLIFGSEASACLVWPEVNSTLCQQSVFRYFTFGYISGNQSIFQDIKKLPPGTSMIWQAGRLSDPLSYWNLLDVCNETQISRKNDSVILEEFSHRFGVAVKERLISDVPLGAFLSGGLDSASVVMEMTRQKCSVSTFTTGFAEASFDEVPQARLTAQHLGCNHHETYSSLSSPNLLLEIAARLDEPLGDTSIVPTYVLCKEARQYLTVALSGDGGDELLAGYVTHQADAYYKIFKKMPKLLATMLGRIVEKLPDNERKVNFFFKLKQFVLSYPLELDEAHAFWRSFVNPDQIQEMTEGHSEDIFKPFINAWQEAKFLPSLEQAMYVDYRTWLLDDVLVKVDRASMNHGLEVRCPFLDHRLVEFCASLPSRFKRIGASGKILLHRYASSRGLDFVAKRKKAGFNAPVSTWLRGPWRELAQTAFYEQSCEISPFISADTIQRMWRDHDEKRRDYGYFLFSVLMFILWYRNKIALNNSR